jgi:hypothetical protein
MAGQVQIYNYCDGYDVAKLYASDLTVQFGADVPTGNVGFRIGIDGNTDFGYTEYQAYCDGQANTTFASGITFGQPLSLYGQSGTYDIIEVFGLSVAFSGSVSIIDGTSEVCPHGWTEVHVPMTVRIGTGSRPIYSKPNDEKEGGDQCQKPIEPASLPPAMALYSAHAMLAMPRREDRRSISQLLTTSAKRSSRRRSIIQTLGRNGHSTGCPM